MRKVNRFTCTLLSLLLALAITLSGCTWRQNQAVPVAVDAPVESSQAPAGDVPDSPEEPAPEYPEGYITLTEEELDLSVRDAKGTGGVVSSANPYASKVGVEILKKGGNAVDAAIAVAYVLGMVEPNASGIGGDGFMLVYEADTGKTTFLDYKGAAPAKLTAAELASHVQMDRFTGKTVLVPGMVAGMAKAHEMFGTLPMQELLQPAIDYAQYGIVVTPRMAQVYMDSYEILNFHKESARIFLNDGFPYVVGDIFKNPDYAQTLRLIVEQGPDVFYTGEIARDLVESVQEADGFLTMEDMAAYRVSVREPVSTTYRGYTVVTAPPSSGGVIVLESLNMAEHFDMQALGHNTPESIHVWSEIFKRSLADRSPYIGDPDFVDPTLALNLTLKSYARDRVKEIDMDTVSLGALKGQPAGYEGQHTTHVSIIDRYGNMVAMTNTLSEYFGCTVTVKGRGFVLNNLASNFSSTATAINAPAPNKKVRSTISPIFLFDLHGKPIATMGTPGASRIITTMSQLVSNIVDFHMDIQTAINQPRIYQNYDGPLKIEGGIDISVVNALERKGHIVEYYGKNDAYFGGAHAVMILPDGTYH
ncbi:MAG TPA: gamma-glutamyltransferase, partial [Clostridiales bacterium]|nr:gamma-glutamyltransferase [Clostridiales bacterium]